MGKVSISKVGEITTFTVDDLIKEKYLQKDELPNLSSKNWGNPSYVKDKEKHPYSFLVDQDGASALISAGLDPDFLTKLLALKEAVYSPRETFPDLAVWKAFDQENFAPLTEPHLPAKTRYTMADEKHKNGQNGHLQRIWAAKAEIVDELRKKNPTIEKISDHITSAIQDICNPNRPQPNLLFAATENSDHYKKIMENFDITTTNADGIATALVDTVHFVRDEIDLFSKKACLSATKSLRFIVEKLPGTQ